jgi:hypothetical protein
MSDSNLVLDLVRAVILSKISISHTKKSATIGGVLLSKDNLATVLIDLSSKINFPQDAIFSLIKIPFSTFVELFNRHYVSLLAVDKNRGTGEFKTIDYSGLIPVADIDNYSHIVMYSKKTKMVTSIDYIGYTKQLSSDESLKPKACKLVFNPYNPEKMTIKEIYGEYITHLNIYTKPEWQLDTLLSPDEIKDYSDKEFPSLFQEFMSHLFPSLECREFILNWLHYALVSRNETYLILNGAKGIGKNIFAEEILLALFGEENHIKAPQSLFDDKFNTLLENKRLIMCDEAQINTPDRISKTKNYINPRQTLEGKGIDAKRTIETYNNFVVLNNNPSDISISWDDRRFSVADLTKIKLNTVWEEGKITSLINSFRNDLDFVRTVGYKLMYRRPTTLKTFVYRGEHYYKLCEHSLFKWQACIVEMALTGEYPEINLADLSREYRKTNEGSRSKLNVKISTVEAFITNYLHEGKYSLGEFIVSYSDWIIRISPQFLNKQENIL